MSALLKNGVNYTLGNSYISAFESSVLGWVVPPSMTDTNEVNGDKFIQRINRIDMSDFAWIDLYNFSVPVMNYKSLNPKAVTIPNTQKSNIFIDLYEAVPWSDVIGRVKDKIIAASDDTILIHDSRYTSSSDIASFKANLKGHYFYYEMANPIEHSISGNEIASTLNSNLTALEFSDFAGGKNLISINAFTVNGSSAYSGGNIPTRLKSNVKYTISMKNSGSASRLYLFPINANGENITNFTISFTNGFGSRDYTPTADVYAIGIYNDRSEVANITEFQIEEGSSVTEFEPFIPSIKKLGNDTTALNESLTDYGMDNKFDGELKKGFYSDTGVYTAVTSNGDTCTNYYSCNSGSTIHIKYSKELSRQYSTQKAIRVCFYDSAKTFLSVVGNGQSGNRYNLIAPTNAKYFTVSFGNQTENLSVEDDVLIFVDNAIDTLKADLTYSIKSKRVTATTDANGFFNTGINFKTIIGAYAPLIVGTTSIFISREKLGSGIAGTTGEVTLQLTDWEGNPLSNVQHTLDVFYLEYVG